MIEQRATVMAVEGDDVWVQTGRQSACGACAANKGCGAGVFAKAFRFAEPRLRVAGEPGMTVGEQVIIGLDEGALVRGSFMVYVMPILAMLVFAVLGKSMTDSEWAISLIGLAGLFAGLVWVKWQGRRVVHDARYQPVIVERLGRCEQGNCEAVQSCGAP